MIILESNIKSNILKYCLYVKILIRNILSKKRRYISCVVKLFFLINSKIIVNEWKTFFSMRKISLIIA